MAPQQTPPPPLPSPLSVERGGGERGACHVCRVARNGAVASAPLSVIESGYKKPSPVGCSPGTAAYVEPPPPPPSSRRQRVVGAIREGDASCHYAPNKSALSGIRGFPSLSPPPTAYPPNPSSLPRSLLKITERFPVFVRGFRAHTGFSSSPSSVRLDPWPLWRENEPSARRHSCSQASCLCNRAV